MKGPNQWFWVFKSINYKSVYAQFEVKGLKQAKSVVWSFNLSKLNREYVMKKAYVMFSGSDMNN